MKRATHPASMTPAEREAARLLFVGTLAVFQRRDVDGGGEVFLSERPGRFCAIGFAGKAIKPAFNYYFKSAESRELYITKWTSNLVAKVTARSTRRSERAADTHQLMLGSILYSTWGYEQTNCDFYQVCAIVSKTMVVIRQIATARTTDGDQHMSGTVKPVPGKFVGTPMRKRATSSGIRLSSFSSASVWDGKPKRISWYA